MRESIQHGGDTWFVQGIKSQSIHQKEFDSFCLIKEFAGVKYSRVAHYLPTTAKVSIRKGRIVQSPAVNISRTLRHQEGKVESDRSANLLGLPVNADKNKGLNPPNTLELVEFVSQELGWSVTQAVWKAVGQAGLATTQKKHQSTRTNE